MPYNGALVYPMESITADELVLVTSDGAPADGRAVGCDGWSLHFLHA